MKSAVVVAVIGISQNNKKESGTDERNLVSSFYLTSYLPRRATKKEYLITC